MEGRGVRTSGTHGSWLMQPVPGSRFASKKGWKVPRWAGEMEMENFRPLAACQLDANVWQFLFPSYFVSAEPSKDDGIIPSIVNRFVVYMQSSYQLMHKNVHKIWKNKQSLGDAHIGGKSYRNLHYKAGIKNDS